MKEKISKLSQNRQKEIINVIRTTQRNNIELTHIADNKANVLLSLNALMVSIIIPFAVSNTEKLSNTEIFIPLLMMTITNGITIFLATRVLKPGDFKNFKNFHQDKGTKFSPFFFGNIFKMERDEFGAYMKDALKDNEDVKRYLADDLYYIGKRLGKKMTLIRIAFNIFTFGILITILTWMFFLFL